MEIQSQIRANHRIFDQESHFNFIFNDQWEKEEKERVRFDNQFIFQFSVPKPYKIKR
jgi:hypothetical protein